MKKSIRRQISAVFLGFIVLVIGLIVFFNMGFMERYYMESKKEILKSGYTKMSEGLKDADYLELLQFCSANNLSVVVADFHEKEPIKLSVNLTWEDAEDLKKTLKLDENSNILVISTEGDTDPVRYREIVWDGLYGTEESFSE